MKGSDFIFDWVYIFYCKCHKINLNCGRSYINPPSWIIIKKATINPINDDDKCFQYTKTVAFSYDEIGKNICKENRKLSIS